MINEGSIANFSTMGGANLFLTRRCNLRCSYCFVDKRCAEDLSAETAERCVNFLVQCAKRSPDSFHIGYIGGEPLVNWSLFKQVTAELRRNCPGINLGFTTNGTLLDKEKVSFIKEKALRVVLSFDGDITSMTDRRYANGRPSYDGVKRGLALLAQNQINYFVQMTITPANVESLCANIVHLLGHGSRRIIFGFALELPWSPQALLTLRKSMQQTFALYLRAYREGADVTFKYINDEVVSYLATVAQRPRIRPACPMADTVFAIDVDGRLYPCQAFVNSPEWSIGDVTSGFDPEARSYAASVDNCKLKPCDQCKLQLFCRKCPRSNYLVNGDPFKTDGVTCTLGKTVYALVRAFVAAMLKEENPRFLAEYGDLINKWNLAGQLQRTK